MLLNSEPHYDHAGGLAELQQASGAELWAGEYSANVIASGGDDPSTILPLRALVWVGIARYPAPRVDHRFRDADTIRVGATTLTAHVTPGHTRGCTSWSFEVLDGARVLNVVSAYSLKVMGGSRYDGYQEDLERSFRVLRSLPADIWITSHARLWGRYRKFVANSTAEHAADPFIDPEGYRAYVDSAETWFRRGVVHEAANRQCGVRRRPPVSAILPSWCVPALEIRRCGRLEPVQRLCLTRKDRQDRREPGDVKHLPDRLIQPEGPQRSALGAHLLCDTEQNA